MPAKKKGFVQVNAPDGAVEIVAPGELLWFRDAFDFEWKDIVMVRVQSGRIYSIDTAVQLWERFLASGVKLAKFSAPEDKRIMSVNAGQVREIEKPNSVLHPAGAGSILVMGPKLRLAVRQTVAESRAIVLAATGDEV